MSEHADAMQDRIQETRQRLKEAEHHPAVSYPPDYKPTTDPPLSLVPLAPGEISAASTSGYHIRATFTVGAGADQYGHLYLVDVITAAAACPAVWEALAQATLAGLCLRCSSLQDAERLIREHVEDAVVENAGAYSWTHAPVIDEPCRLCQELGMDE